MSTAFAPAPATTVELPTPAPMPFLPSGEPNPEHLREFLQSLPAGELAGVSCAAGLCPLARWLEDLYGQRVDVWKYGYAVHSGHARLVSAGWWRAFVERVDTSGWVDALSGAVPWVRDIDEVQVEVTREQALAHLNAALATEAGA